MNKNWNSEDITSSDQPMTWWHKLMVGAMLLVVLGGAVALSLLMPHTAPGREVWWTKQDCPMRVQSPCLDPSVSLHDIPRWAGGLAPE